jgi:hypothetical protein
MESTNLFQFGGISKELRAVSSKTGIIILPTTERNPKPFVMHNRRKIEQENNKFIQDFGAETSYKSIFFKIEENTRV